MNLFRITFVLLWLGVASSVEAQILEGIEINRIGMEAEIRIRFSTEIQYLRHVPVDQGKLLRISIRLANPEFVERDLPQEAMASPETDLVPKFRVFYPELNNGMLVSFSQSTAFKVRPGVDARSIIITVPMLAGAKDFSVEEHAHSEQQVAQQGPAPLVGAATSVAAPIVVPAAPKAPAPASPKVAVTAPGSPTPKKPAEESLSVVTAATEPPKPPASPAAATLNASPPTSNTQGLSVEVVPGTPAQPGSSTPADNSAVIAAPPILSNEEIERLAKTFYADAQKAISEKDLPKAINRLNRVLGLPPNTQTEAAQALIGQVREQNGEIAKARAEYELFLRAFPNSAETPKIKTRLAALPSQSSAQANRSTAKVFPKDPGPAEWNVFGSFAQYWYSGQSHIETTTPPPPGQLTFNTDTLSLTDQDSLISSLDVNARRRDAITDTRIVLRYIDNHNYLKRGKGYSRLNSAYVEQTDRQAGYFVRAGRQNPNGGGVQERFDGANVGYNVSPDWRVNAVAGVPVEFGLSYKKQFYGTSIERIAQPEHLGYSLYFLNQTLEGAINRRAVGSDMRYFDSQLTVYGLLDYDIDFKDLNIALVQANYRSLDTTNYFAVVDHRKTPSLSLLSSLPAYAGMDIKDILTTTPIEQIRDAGKALTAESNLFSIGFTRPVSEKWQLGADYRIAEISGIDGFGLMPAQPGTGNNHVISGQAIGNSIFRTNDVAVANLSLIHSPTMDGQAYGFNYVIQLFEPLRFDGGLRFYTQKDSADETQTRLNPSARLTYRVKDSVTLEAEAGNETAKTDGPTRKDKSDRRYLYFGYRWDFR